MKHLRLALCAATRAANELAKCLCFELTEEAPALRTNAVNAAREHLRDALDALEHIERKQ